MEQVFFYYDKKQAKRYAALMITAGIFVALISLMLIIRSNFSSDIESMICFLAAASVCYMISNGLQVRRRANKNFPLFVVALDRFILYSDKGEPTEVLFDNCVSVEVKRVPLNVNKFFMLKYRTAGNRARNIAKRSICLTTLRPKWRRLSFAPTTGL